MVLSVKGAHQECLGFRQNDRGERAAMQLKINKDALDLVFRTLLTCRRRLNKKEEDAIFRLLKGTRLDEQIDYGKVLAVFPIDTETVFHRLGDFAVWQAPAGVDSYAINREHVVRHFSSTYHWNHVVASGLDITYKEVRHVSSWFLGHMLLPVRITSVHGEKVSGSYDYEGGKVWLLNLFAPREYKPVRDEIWAVHPKTFSQVEGELRSALRRNAH
jgi:hypothetical protein